VNWTDLPLARATVDRAAERRAEPDLVARLREDPSTRVVVVHRGLVATVTSGPADAAPGDADAGRADAGRADAGPDAAADTPREVVGLDLLTAAEVADAAPSADGWLFLGADDQHGYLALVLPDTDTDGDSEPDPSVPPADLEGFAGTNGTNGTNGTDRAAAERMAALQGELVAGRQWSHLRQVGAAMQGRDAGLGVTAVALAAWHRSHRCCPRCGTPTEVAHAGWVRHCPADGTDQYPRTDPAVIMAVVDADDRLLLGHAAHWPERRFSTLAGYVEPGESLEQAVRREVDEEVGVTVGEVAYRGSQPWPFPASLMLAFRAQATSTDLRPDGVEVTEARWFTRAELADAAAAGEVLLPMRASIARALIEEWAGSALPGA
jgi:NAD+ diphosphatase